jgi:hypothetical protein
MKTKEQLAKEYSRSEFDRLDIHATYPAFIAGYDAGWDAMKKEVVDELLMKIDRLYKQINNQ